MTERGREAEHGAPRVRSAGGAPLPVDRLSACNCRGAPMTTADRRYERRRRHDDWRPASPAGQAAVTAAAIEAAAQAIAESVSASVADALNTCLQDADLLSIVEVAAKLRCSEDTVRRIPASDLQVYRVGKSNLYFREDLLRYVRRRAVSKGVTAETVESGVNVDDVVAEMLGSGRANMREPSERRAR